MGQEVDGFDDAGAVCGRIDDLVAAIMLEGWADVPPFFAVWIP